MSAIYDEYLDNHKNNVKKGYEWLIEYVPNIFMTDGVMDERLKAVTEHLCTFSHDFSKTTPEEYNAYDAYFYGNRSYEVVKNFELAWLTHIHKNKHHWQYWVLINDDPVEGMKLLEIPKEYIIEMICDWWSFSWNNGNLYEIFDWYNEHKDHIKMNSDSRKIVEYILHEIKTKLDEENNKGGA